MLPVKSNQVKIIWIGIFKTGIFIYREIKKIKTKRLFVRIVVEINVLKAKLLLILNQFLMELLTPKADAPRGYNATTRVTPPTKNNGVPRDIGH